MALMMSRPSPVLENMLLSVVVICSPTDGEVGAGGVVVGDGVEPIGVAVLTITRGAGRALVAVSWASRVSTSDGGAALASGPGVISKPISSPAGSSVASVSVGNATPFILAVGVGVLVGVLVAELVGVLVEVLVEVLVGTRVGVTVAGGVQGPMRVQISTP